MILNNFNFKNRFNFILKDKRNLISQCKAHHLGTNQRKNYILNKATVLQVGKKNKWGSLKAVTVSYQLTLTIWEGKMGTKIHCLHRKTVTEYNATLRVGYIIVKTNSG